MADEQYDGRVRINTELDNSGFEKGSDQLKASVSGLARAINGITGSMTSFFSKRWKMPEPELPEKEAMELPQPDPVKPEVDTTALDAGTRQVHRDMEQITRDVGADLPEPKPVEPELDSAEFDRQAGKMQSSISRIVGEIDRMVSTSSQGFRSTAAVLSFNNKLDLTAEKIAEAREQLAEFAEQQIPTDQYAETTAAIQKAEAALLKLYDRRDQMADLGVDENSKQWQKLELQIAAAEEEVERYEMAADRMRETGKAFVDPAATEQYAAMVEQIEQAERDIEANAGMIRQEQIEQARLNVLIAQEKYAHASNAVSRQLALRQLQNAQNALAMVAEKSVTPAPDPAAGSAWRRLGQTIKSGVNGATSAVKQFGTLAGKATSGVKGLASKVKGFFSGLGKKGGSGIDGLFKKFTGLKNMLASRIKRTFISFLFNQIKESFNELAKFDARFDQSVSNLRNRTSELGANVMATFGGLIRQIEPIISKAIDAASQAVTKLNAVMTAIRGENTMQVAVRRTESYADSLRDASKAAKEDQKAQEKLNATLTSIDEIHKLDAPKDDSASTDAGADAEKVVYENVPVDSILGDMSEFGQNIAQRIIDGIKSGNWNDAGRAISEGLNAAIAKIDEKLLAARPKAEKAAEDIADLLNGMVAEFDGYAAGKTIADGLNLALGTANAFLKRFNFYEFGATIGDGITGAVQNFEWETAGEFIGNGINGIISTARGIIEHTDWNDLGSKMSDGFDKLIETIDWANAAQTLSLGFIGILDSVSSFLEDTDWDEVGHKIVEFFENVDWAGVTTALVRLIGAAIGSIGALIRGIFDSLTDIGDRWGEKLFEKYGDQFDAAGGSIADGILAGVKAIFKDVGSWCKTNIVDPFVKGFKKAFGIASPSKKMKPYGEYVADGILAGIKDIFSDVTGWAKDNILEPFTKGFASAFRVVSGKAQELLSSGESIAEGIKGGIQTGWTTIKTFIGLKKEEMKRDSEGLADSATAGFADTEKFRKAGENVTKGVTAGINKDTFTQAGKGIIDGLSEGLTDQNNWDEKVGGPVAQRAGWIAGGFLDYGDYSGSGRRGVQEVGSGLTDQSNWDAYIGGPVQERARWIAEGFENGDYFGAGQRAVQDFYYGMQDILSGGTTPIEDMVAAAKETGKHYQGAALRTVQTLAEVQKEADDLGQKDIEINVTTAAVTLDRVADKLAAIAQIFQAIGRAFPDMTAVPVPAAALGAIAPAGTRVTDDGTSSDSRTATLLEKLIGRIEELEEMVASRPIQLESKVMLDQREIGRATAEYNAGNSRVTNGNGGANRW